LNIIKALSADVSPLEGSTSAPTTAAQTTGPVTVGPTTAAAGENPEPASSSAPLILGGLASLVVAGALVTALAIRRRRSF
jgi:hypothetical protein